MPVLPPPANEARRESPAAESSSRRWVAPAPIRVEYRPAEESEPSGPALAVVRFGGAEAGTRVDSGAPLQIDVALEPLGHARRQELWMAAGPIQSGRDGRIRYACDGHYRMAVLECTEREYPDLESASEAVYRELCEFQRHGGYPHLLRVWNYFDAIHAGDADQERYRRFCVGRTRGLGERRAGPYPAASVLGCQVASGRLQVYWLASSRAGVSVENPRQISAYLYPREYGPVAPTFARAVIAADGTRLISGTASIVGHESRHRGDPLAQLDEVVANLQALEEQANAIGPSAAGADGRPLLKIYLRDPADLPRIEFRLERVWPQSRRLFLAADVCRRELLLEIEAIF